MWTFIITISSILTLAAAAYITLRFRKFCFIKNLNDVSRVMSWTVTVMLTVALALLLSVAMNIINLAIVFIFAAVFLLIADLVALIVKKLTGKTEKHPYTVIAALAVAFVYMWCGWLNAHQVRNTLYVVNNDKNVSLNIVFFADAHMGGVFDADKLNEYVEEINATAPDAVFIVGDLVDDETTKEQMLKTCEALGNLRPRLGTYFTFGNHDTGYYSAQKRGWDTNDLMAALNGNSVHIFDDDMYYIAENVCVIGRRDRSKERRPIAELMESCKPEDYVIVLDHQPSCFDEEAAAGADLVLCGHTHGGQMFPINIVVSAQNDRLYGRETRGKTDFIVTSGIADWELKFKMGVTSEYVTVYIRG